MYLGLKLLPSQLAMMGLNEKDSIVSRLEHLVHRLHLKTDDHHPTPRKVNTCFSCFGVQNNSKLAWANAITLDTEGSIAVGLWLA